MDSVKQGGGRAVLASYWYIQKRPTFLQDVHTFFADHSLRVCLDSGAHSFHAGELMDMPFVDIDDYVKRYAEWIWSSVGEATAFVEFDVNLPDHPDALEKWREEHFRPLELAGVPIIFVWHPKDGDTDAGWTELCKKHGYVGMSMDVAEPGQRVREARKYLTPVHGFALSAPPLFQTIPFHSVDSTSWKGGEMYGDAYVWWGGEMIRFKGTEKRRAYKSYYLQHGLDFDNIVADVPKACSVANVKAFVLMQDEVTRRRSNQEYGGKKMPPPAVIDTSNLSALKKLPVPVWITNPGYLEQLDPESVKIDAAIASNLQWGFFDDLREKLDNPTWSERIRDVWKISETDDASLDQARLLSNSSLIAKTVGAQTRELDSDEPTRPVHSRSDRLEVESDDEEFFDPE